MKNKKNILILLIIVIISLMIMFFGCVHPEEDDENNEYPAVEKWISWTKKTAVDTVNNDQFGHSVAISGDYAITGAPYVEGDGTNRGASYIFHRTGSAEWDTGTKLLSLSLNDHDNFGFSVAISGDYAIAGAPYEDGGGTNRGAAYIFIRTGDNSWAFAYRINASDAADNDNFGYSVSISGDYAIVGAYTEDASGTDRGAAYIFRRTAVNTWDAGTKIIASDAADNDNFGYSVSISGNYAIAGAYKEDGGGTDRGAAYIYHRTGVNIWDAGTKIAHSFAADNDYFGNSVSISGDYAIAGVKHYSAVYPVCGAAYIFHRTGTNTWDAGIRILATDCMSADIFGYSVSISGNYAVVGAINNDENGPQSGAAYIYQRTGTNAWDNRTKLNIFDVADDDNFGNSVSISGDYAIAGAHFEDGSGTDRGAVYILK